MVPVQSMPTCRSEQVVNILGGRDGLKTHVSGAKTPPAPSKPCLGISDPSWLSTFMVRLPSPTAKSTGTRTDVLHDM